MTFSKVEFTSYSSLTSFMSIIVANDDRMIAIRKDTVIFDNEMSNDTIVIFTVDDVLYVSQLSIDLLSVSAFTDKSAQIMYDGDDYRIYVKDEN